MALFDIRNGPNGGRLRRAFFYGDEIEFTLVKQGVTKGQFKARYHFSVKATITEVETPDRETEKCNLFLRTADDDEMIIIGYDPHHRKAERCEIRTGRNRSFGFQFDLFHEALMATLERFFTKSDKG